MSITTHQVYADSLLGTGVNLKIKDNTASGTLLLKGSKYNAPNLSISIKGNEIKLSGYVDGTSHVLLMATGIHTNGIEYKFDGTIQNNGKSTPITFTVLLTNDVKNVITDTTQKQLTTSPVIPNNLSPTISSSQGYSQSLLSSGINLKIINNTASGTMILKGKHYNAPNLIMINKGDQIKLTGHIQGNYNLLLNAVGIHTTGIEYQFNGAITNNDKSEPIKFTALLTTQGKQTITTMPKQNIANTVAPQQTPGLPMLMLTTHNDRVYMAHTYNFVVKIFDPKSNPQKIFDQFNGGISDVNIIATILDPDNKIIGQSSGKTDSKGSYQDGINIPYTQYQQEQVQVKINATKKGYATQLDTLPLVLIHPNSGSAPVCQVTTSSLPDGTFTGGAVAYSQTLSSSSCSSPTWAITSGSLPGGLTLASSSGIISGTPTGAGTFNFVVTVTASDGRTATASLSIKIN